VVQHPAIVDRTAPPIAKVPFFGRTWYKRGVGYWSRRVLMSSMFLIALIVGTVLLVDIVLYVLGDSSLPLIAQVLILAGIAADRPQLLSGVCRVDFRRTQEARG
jgi:sugar phosphate permease